MSLSGAVSLAHSNCSNSTHPDDKNDLPLSTRTVQAPGDLDCSSSLTSSGGFAFPCPFEGDLLPVRSFSESPRQVFSPAAVFFSRSSLHILLFLSVQKTVVLAYIRVSICVIRVRVGGGGNARPNRVDGSPCQAHDGARGYALWLVL